MVQVRSGSQTQITVEFSVFSVVERQILADIGGAHIASDAAFAGFGLQHVHAVSVASVRLRGHSPFLVLLERTHVVYVQPGLPVSVDHLRPISAHTGLAVVSHGLAEQILPQVIVEVDVQERVQFLFVHIVVQHYGMRLLVFQIGITQADNQRIGMILIAHAVLYGSGFL